MPGLGIPLNVLKEPNLRLLELKNVKNLSYRVYSLMNVQNQRAESTRLKIPTCNLSVKCKWKKDPARPSRFLCDHLSAACG